MRPGARAPTTGGINRTGRRVIPARIRQNSRGEAPILGINNIAAFGISAATFIIAIAASSSI